MKVLGEAQNNRGDVYSIFEEIDDDILWPIPYEAFKSMVVDKGLDYPHPEFWQKNMIRERGFVVPREANIGEGLVPSYMDLMKERVAAVLVNLSEVSIDEVVLLDEGCGEGNAVNEFNDPSAQSEIFERLNLSPISCRMEGVDKAESPPENSQNILYGVDVANLPMEDQKYSGILSYQLYRYVEDKLRAFEEAWRVLCVGGMAVLNLDPIFVMSPNLENILEVLFSEDEDFRECIRIETEQNIEEEDNEGPLVNKSFLVMHKKTEKPLRFPYQLVKVRRMILDTQFFESIIYRWRCNPQEVEYVRRAPGGLYTESLYEEA